VTSQGTAGGRFQRAIERKNLWDAQIAAKERAGGSPSSRAQLRRPFAEVKSERLESVAIRWHGRFELEASLISSSEAQLALAALAHLRENPEGAMPLLKRLQRRVHPKVVQ
jgi:hypothetical protein